MTAIHGPSITKPVSRPRSRKSDIVGPAVGVGFDVMATAMIAAIDQHVADAGFAHLAECDFLRVGRHRRLPTTRPLASSSCCR